MVKCDNAWQFFRHVCLHCVTSIHVLSWNVIFVATRSITYLCIYLYSLCVYVMLLSTPISSFPKYWMLQFVRKHFLECRSFDIHFLPFCPQVCCAEWWSALDAWCVCQQMRHVIFFCAKTFPSSRRCTVLWSNMSSGIRACPTFNPSAACDTRHVSSFSFHDNPLPQWFFLLPFLTAMATLETDAFGCIWFGIVFSLSTLTSCRSRLVFCFHFKRRPQPLTSEHWEFTGAAGCLGARNRTSRSSREQVCCHREW